MGKVVLAASVLLEMTDGLMAAAEDRDPVQLPFVDRYGQHLLVEAVIIESGGPILGLGAILETEILRHLLSRSGSSCV